ncbi:hypothetical protein O9K51_07543 [Purpureocillium lavendulum]|uniref:Uncharacterized protein n=1 Tax=Purpureocillium lavendulum TaxID=1247861 RepID=A0AB34FL73_9HYPO|nr:hypothetical protein O9K51_07543 [Purpureocillium lavendulum]
MAAHREVRRRKTKGLYNADMPAAQADGAGYSSGTNLNDPEGRKKSRYKSRNLGYQ